MPFASLNAHQHSGSEHADEAMAWENAPRSPPPTFHRPGDSVQGIEVIASPH